MARIDLVDLAHSYGGNDAPEESFALKPVTMTWRQGGAYALLGPSGCGKTTLLNLISGIVTPSRGKILFDGTDITPLSTQKRNIAQVFQFPVIYDTMTVGENLAFPLKNRGVPKSESDARVAEIAALLDLTPYLSRKATRLTADAKQKISLGRGLVRSDVAAVLFDEPLTVIDPELKWQLRSKLEARIDGHTIALNRSYHRLPSGAKIEIGVRPEFVEIAPAAPGLLAANIERIDDLGRIRFARVRIGNAKLAARVPPSLSIPDNAAGLLFDPSHVHVYADSVLVEGSA